MPATDRHVRRIRVLPHLPTSPTKKPLYSQPPTFARPASPHLLNPTGRALSRPDSNGSRKRIFLADRHPLVREWLAHSIGNESDLMVCGHPADASAALRGIAALGPHAIIMDLTIEDGSGLDVIERILSRCPNTAVLVLSTHDEAHYAARLLRAGTRGCISKTEPTRKILSALRCVLQGKLYLGPATAQSLIGGRAARVVARPSLVAVGSSIETLSDRELEVFAMTGRGLGTRRIADALHLSPKTIQAYHGRIKAKLRLRDATELMREAIGWVEKPGKRNRRATRAPNDDGTAAVGDVTILPPGY